MVDGTTSLAGRGEVTRHVREADRGFRPIDELEGITPVMVEKRVDSMVVAAAAASRLFDHGVV